MSKLSWVSGGIILLITIGGAVFFISHKDAGTTSTEPTDSGNPAADVNGESFVIMYTDAGFTPPSLTVTPGTTITWSNQSSRKLWVIDASLKRDTCPSESTGEALNECETISQGGSYSFTAPREGTITYSNRENRTDTGTIKVSGVPAGINPDAIAQ